MRPLIFFNTRDARDTRDTLCVPLRIRNKAIVCLLVWYCWYRYQSTKGNCVLNYFNRAFNMSAFQFLIL